MFSLLKKTVIAVAFAITFAVAASPVDYLSANSDAYAYINFSSLLKTKMAQPFLPLLENELKSSGVSVKDLDSEVALGINVDNLNNKTACNIDVVMELKNAVSKKLFDSIKNNDKDLAATTVAGKPALSSNAGRIIQQDSQVLILQLHAEGNKPFATLNANGKNPLKKISDIRKYDLFLYANVAKILKKAQAFVPADSKEMLGIVSGVKSACIAAKILPNDKYAISLSIFCINAEEAAKISAFTKEMLGALSGNELAKPLLGKLKSKTTDNRVGFSIILDEKDFAMLQQLAK